MNRLVKKMYKILIQARLGRVVLQLVASIFFTFKTKRFSRIFYDGLWVHQHYNGVIVETKISWNRTILKTVADTRDYCFRFYKPKLGDIILDVGAGIGSETFVFSKEVGEDGKVVSIEAHPKTFLCLTEMCKYNNLKNVITLDFAVIDKESDLFIEDLDSHIDNRLVRDGAKGILVRGTTLDQIVRDLNIAHVDFIKMNIEGAEKLAIKGMSNIIKRTRCVCIACHDFIAEREGNMEMKTKNEVIDFLLDNNFKVSTRENDEIDWVRDCVYGINNAYENSKISKP